MSYNCLKDPLIILVSCKCFKAWYSLIKIFIFNNKKNLVSIILLCDLHDTWRVLYVCIKITWNNKNVEYTPKLGNEFYNSNPLIEILSSKFVLTNLRKDTDSDFSWTFQFPKLFPELCHFSTKLWPLESPWCSILSSSNQQYHWLQPDW